MLRTGDVVIQDSQLTSIRMVAIVLDDRQSLDGLQWQHMAGVAVNNYARAWVATTGGRIFRWDGAGEPFEMDKSAFAAVRTHQNGMLALIDRADTDLEQYAWSVGPTRDDDVRLPNYAGTVDDAKRAADHASGCPQPCTCPPWSA